MTPRETIFREVVFSTLASHHLRHSKMGSSLKDEDVQSFADSSLRLISRYLYLVITLLLLGTYLLFALQRSWQGDFWTHAAISRELAQRPFSPTNPFVRGGEPAIPYWPYDASVGLLSVLLNIEPHNSLALFGGINLLFLLFALKNFVLHFFKDELLPPFALVFILFFWGENPWFWSSVYSHQTLFFIAPYPSFFAFALTLWTATTFDRQRMMRRLVIISTIILLVHPITFMFHLLLLSSIALARRDKSKARDIAVSTLVSLLVGLFWPFFPLTRVIGNTAFSADPNAELIYRDVIGRIYPALFGVVPLVILGRRLGGIFLYLATASGCIYLFGYYSEQWNVGRVLPFFVFILQIHLALGVLLLLRGAERRYQQKLLTVIAVVPLFVSLVLWSRSLLDPLEDQVSLEELGFVRSHLSDTTTVLAHPQLSLLLTAMGARIVTIDYPPFIGGDFTTRARAVHRFFCHETSREEREQILKDYNVNLVLLQGSSPSLHLPLIVQSGAYALYKY